MPGNAHDRMVELLDEAGQTYFNALKTGLKYQEDVTQWWSDQIKSVNGSADWAKKPQEAMAEVIKQWQANAEDSLKLMDKSMQQSVELLNKAFDVGQADSVKAAQEKLNELWQSSITAMQNNVQTTMQANTQVAEAWMQLVAKQSEAAAASAE